jgi:hypothetical protein
MRLADEAFEKGWDCRFVFGAALTRKGVALLLYHFAGELFIFELTSAQARAGDFRPKTVIAASSPCALAYGSEPAVVSIERFQLQDRVLRRDQPIKARIDVDSALPFMRPYAVRLSCWLGKTTCMRFVYPSRPLMGKVSLDVEFEALASTQLGIAEYAGPLAVFVSLVEIPNPNEGGPDRPISDTSAVLAEIA